MFKWMSLLGLDFFFICFAYFTLSQHIQYVLMYPAPCVLPSGIKQTIIMERHLVPCQSRLDPQARGPMRIHGERDPGGAAPLGSGQAVTQQASHSCNVGF